MRCKEVINELAAPTGELDSAALSAHLSKCGACADWAKQAARFDRLWEATRPAEPAAETWDAMWARIADHVDSAPRAASELASATALRASANGIGTSHRTEPAIRPFAESGPARRWSWAAIGLIGLAQAAGIVLAVGLALQGTGGDSHRHMIARAADSPSAIASPADSAIEIEEGSVVVIQMDGQAAKVVDLKPQAVSYRLENRLRNLEGIRVDDWYVMFNQVESLHQPIVAMKE